MNSEGIKKNYFQKIDEFHEKFPTDSKKKEVIFNRLKDIMEVLGCYLNDNNFKFKYENEKLILKNVYTEKEIDVSGTDSQAFFEQILKLVIENTKELNDVKNILNQ